MNFLNSACISFKNKKSLWSWPMSWLRGGSHSIFLAHLLRCLLFLGKSFSNNYYPHQIWKRKNKLSQPQIVFWWVKNHSKVSLSTRLEAQKEVKYLPCRHEDINSFSDTALPTECNATTWQWWCALHWCTTTKCVKAPKLSVGTSSKYYSQVCVTNSHCNRNKEKRRGKREIGSETKQSKTRGWFLPCSWEEASMLLPDDQQNKTNT